MEIFQKIKLFFKAFYKVPLLVPSWDEKDLIESLKANLKDRDELRKKIKELYNVKYAFDFNLGRSAIQIALRSFGLQREDEVIMSTYSCRGTIEPILKENLTPVLVDIDDTFNISPESIEKHITKKTRVIIMSHLYGYPAQIDKIIAIAKKHKLYLIDDAAQVVGLKYKDKMVGTFGDIGILSFGIGKSLSATGGGMLITNDEDIAGVANLNWLFAREDEEVRRTKYRRKFYERSRTAPFYLVFDKFQKRKDWEIKRMSLIDCSFVLNQLPKLNGLISFRQIIALTYSRLLENESHIEIPQYEIIEGGNGHIFTKYVIKLKSYYREDKFSRFLRMNGIETETNYKPLHHYPEYKQYKKRFLIKSEMIYKKVLTIPCHQRMTYQDKEYVANKVKEFFK
jgi:dTDP-4-amino-4,6-dideoxygalactose transaminase